MNVSGVAFTGKDLAGFMGEMKSTGKFSDRLEAGRMSDIADRVRRIFRRPQETPAEVRPQPLPRGHAQVRLAGMG